MPRATKLAQHEAVVDVRIYIMMSEPHYPLFECLSVYPAEQVVCSHDPVTGLKALIAIHNTALGPSLGGVRMWHYASETTALMDVLRLARGMTYKAAVAGLNFGGGKAVIIGDAARHKTPALFQAFGRMVDRLGGRYITAPDVNTCVDDMRAVNQTTRYVVALPEDQQSSGDPSVLTAYGVYMAMKAAMQQMAGTDSLEGKRIGIQGLGKLGQALLRRLKQEEAQVWITDINEDRLATAMQIHPQATVVDAEALYNQPLDIFAPCALGAVLNDVTIPQLDCSAIVGGANNQLADETRHGQMLQQRNILYIPDFIASAGGLINVSIEWNGPYSSEAAYERTQRIYDTCRQLLARVSATGNLPQHVAIAMGDERIAAAQAAPNAS